MCTSIFNPKTFRMRKQIFAFIVMASLSTAVVSAPAIRHVEKFDPGNSAVLTSGADHIAIDMAFINDAFVPEVQQFHLTHVESISLLSDGFKPPTEAKVRGPTTVKPVYSPPRDKLRCV